MVKPLSFNAVIHKQFRSQTLRRVWVARAVHTRNTVRGFVIDIGTAKTAFLSYLSNLKLASRAIPPRARPTVQF